jgi:hypothetical protein
LHLQPQFSIIFGEKEQIGHVLLANESFNTFTHLQR